MKSSATPADTRDRVGQPVSPKKAELENQTSKKIPLPKNILELLPVATKGLKLKQVFTDDGYSIYSVSEVDPDSVLYVSCADPDTSIDLPPHKVRTPQRRH
jgi:hypothetical protein